MKFTKSVVASALVALVQAQTPGNFSVVSTAPLNVIGQPGNVNILPGSLLPQSDVLDVPSISPPTDASGGIYVAFMIDPTTSRGNFLHWFQPNLVSNSTGSLTVDVTARNASAAVGASYIYPQPPADGYAHQYVILLYRQPSNWAVPTNYSTVNPPAAVTDRIGFNMSDFQRAAGLGAPLGTDYFRVLNGTAAQSSTVASVTSSATATSDTSSGSATAASTTASGSASASASASATRNFASVNSIAQVVIAGYVGAFAVPLLF